MANRNDFHFITKNRSRSESCTKLFEDVSVWHWIH